METEVHRQGLTLSNSRLAELQTLAGRNPMLAKKVIQRERLGIQQDLQHTQYVVIMPVLFAFAVVRFVGMGTGNKGLYIRGGMCLGDGNGVEAVGPGEGSQEAVRAIGRSRFLLAAYLLAKQSIGSGCPSLGFSINSVY